MKKNKKVEQLSFFDDPNLSEEIKKTSGEFELPIWGFPLKAQEWITENAEVYQCCRDFFSISGLMATAVAAGKQFKLDDGKYTNYPIFYAGIVAPQGTNKTTPLNIAFAPIEEFDNRVYTQLQEDVKLLSSKEKKNNNKINPPMILIKDTTPEFICAALEEQPYGTCIFRDELDSKFAEDGRYNKSNARQMELSLWSGNSYTKTRATQDLVRVFDPCLSIFGSIQPGILASTFGNPQTIESGYLSRWLWVYPDSVSYPQYVNKTIDPKLKDWYRNYMRNILDQRGTSTIINLEEGAMELYKKYHNEIQEQIKACSDDSKKGILSKLQIHVLRYALAVYACHYYASNEAISKGISTEMMEFAIVSMEYFQKSSFKVIDLIISSMRNRNSVTTVDKLSNKDLIIELSNRYTIKNIQTLADALGVSRPAISRILNSKDTDDTKLRLRNAR